jgi:beta-phosphoglucomutase
MALKGVIFDLDGVITDTAEYHYLGWQRLADEEGLPFDRMANEALRGVSRRESLRLILGERQIDEATIEAMMTRKNAYYQEMLKEITAADLLPGVAELLDLLDEAGIPYALASASRNAVEVVERLGIHGRLAAIADGNSVSRAKPAPDLFRFAAAQLNLHPGQCLVVEDALAGVEAAVAAGMPVLASGPAERFGPKLAHVARRESLEGVTLAELEAITEPDPLWCVVEGEFNPNRMHHMETVFTTGNGYFASRGSFEEGYPGESALTFAHGIYDDMPIVFTELVNLPNWLDCRILVDGHSYRLDRGEILYYRRWLDLQEGVLRREVRWQAPHGPILDLTFERFIAYHADHVGALRVLVTAVNQDCVVTIEDGINGHVANDQLLHWQHLDQGWEPNGAWLRSMTRKSRVELGTAAKLISPVPVLGQACPGQPSLMVSQPLAVGQTLYVDKLVAYVSSRDMEVRRELRGTQGNSWELKKEEEGGWDVVVRAREEVNGRDYDALKAEHRAGWLAMWRETDVVIEGDAEAQLAMRFSLFQLQVAAPKNDDRVSIGAKTMSGLGYRGHVFWDTEIFALPFFIFTQPAIARNMLMYRYHTLPGARRKAAGNGFSGAQYAWESAATGDEVTPTWVPDFTGKGLVRIWTGDIEIHITADVAYALIQYWRVTGDDEFMRDYGAEMILDTARFWGDRAELEEGEAWSEERGAKSVESGRRYALRDVIGPDEYHDHVDNNVFTNRMAQWHLETAQRVLGWLEEKHPEKAAELRERLDLNPARLGKWQDVAANLILHYDRTTGLMEQFDNFFQLKEVNWPAYQDRTLSMQVILGIEGANEHQVLKQADVILLLCLLREEYDERTWQANWDYYNPRTDHSYGSSLSPAMHAWAAAEMERPEEAYNHFMLAARADLKDIRGNAGDGIHAASAGGLWQAAVFGFAGLRLTANGFKVEPILPTHWQRLAFPIRYQGQRYYVEIGSGGDYTIALEEANAEWEL